MAIAGFSLFVLGIVFLIVAPINRKKNRRCTMQAPGRLTEIIDRENSDGPLPSMYVYSYRVDGIEYQLKTVDRSPEANKIGDHCTIWYNPAKPKDAQAFHYESEKVFKLLLLIGIALLLLGLVLLVVSAVL